MKPKPWSCDMKITVTRWIATELSTIGRLFVDGSWVCYTLEPVTIADLNVKPRAIPAGTYRLTIRWSPKHGRYVPCVEGVPGFVGIEIHVGNFPRDTLGCTLVGLGMQTDEVTGSHGAFDKLFALLLGGRTLPEHDINAVLECGQITYEDSNFGAAA
jgi:hypothetical protein